MTHKEPDFMMGLNVPINIPSQEEIELYTEGSRLEPFIGALIQAGHCTKEEAAAYVKFISEFALFTPFVLDSFLATYRSALERASTPEKSSKILTPNNKGKILIPS